MASTAASVKQKREPLKSPRRDKTLVTKAGTALQEIASHVEDTTSDITAIVDASREQSTALIEINRAINTVAKAHSKTLPWWKSRKQRPQTSQPQKAQRGPFPTRQYNAHPELRLLVGRQMPQLLQRHKQAGKSSTKIADRMSAQNLCMDYRTLRRGHVRVSSFWAA